MRIFAFECFKTVQIALALKVACRGTVMAPTAIMAMSEITHSGRFSDKIAILSPFSTPNFCRAELKIITFFSKSLYVTGK